MQEVWTSEHSPPGRDIFSLHVPKSGMSPCYFADKQREGGGRMSSKHGNPFRDPIIKVIGVGGLGCKAVRTMVQDNDLRDVQCICADTDFKHLRRTSARNKIHHIRLGEKLAKGLGTEGNTNLARDAAVENKATIHAALTKGACSPLTSSICAECCPSPARRFWDQSSVLGETGQKRRHKMPS